MLLLICSSLEIVMKLKEYLKVIKFALVEIIEIDKKYYIWGFVFTLFAVLDPLYNILPSKVVIDMLASDFSVSNCLMFLLALFIIGSFTNICSQWYRNKYIPIFNTKLQQNIRKKVFYRTYQTYYGNFDKPVFYDKYKIALNQMDGGTIGIVSLLFTTLSQILSIFLIGTIVIVTNPLLLCIVIIQVTLTVFLNIKQGAINYSFDIENVPNDRKNQYVGRVLFIQDFIKDLKVFNFLNLLFSWQDSCYKRSRKIIKKYSLRKSIISYVLTITNLFVRLVMYFYLAWSVYKGKNTLGDLSAMLAATITLSGLLQGIVSVFPQMERQCRYLKDLYYYLYPINDKYLLDVKTLEFRNQLEFNNVTFSYNDKQDMVLKGINLTLKRGQKIAIVGENGAGKSTLLSLIMGLYKPSSGEILVDSFSIEDDSLLSLTNSGSILQNSRAYAFSIAENVLFREVLTDSDANLVNEALSFAGLSEKVASLPKGIYTLLSTEFDDEGVNFSGGEVQKLALARVYAANKDIWIFDEPSSNLDPVAEYEFYDKMFNAPSDKTIIFITHKMKMASHADMIYFMKDGNFIESGTHNELMKLKGNYFKYFSVQDL